MKRFLFIYALLAGCVGNISGFGEGGSSSDSDATTDGDETDGDEPIEPRKVCESDERDQPGPRLLRRLTGAEFTASVRDVLGLSTAEWAGHSLPPDASAESKFTNDADRLQVKGAYAEQLLASARAIAEATTQANVLPRVLPCASQGGEACARTYLDSVGRRLYRRKLTGDETQRFLDLHGKITASADFKTWVYWATVGLVNSPNFVYRSELGIEAAGGFELTGAEMATAMAYDLTGKPPSLALLELGESGGLATPEARLAAARELAYDGAGNLRRELRAQILEFNSQWLGLGALPNTDKSAVAYPSYTAEVRAAMARETEAFVSHVLLDQRGTVADLLTSPVTFLDQTLTAYYGYGFAGPSMTQIDRPAEWGVGLLAQGSLLAINASNEWSSPTRRGLLVRNRLLCEDVPPPPPVVGDLEPPSPDLTTRERYEVHVSRDGICSGCHTQMDPIGFSFENFDAAGRYRSQENGQAIDASGYIAGLGSANIEVNGASELATALAARPEVGECMAAFMASYTFGLNQHDTPCLVSSLAEQFGRGEISVVEYWIGLAATPHFSRRVE